ncbi:MAG: hypothetical protein C5B54_11985 [Acidobacteria bacterium]|nr:MAG: hypothetical protein C5B54_11985 [Acidobacteriota bacterium]
MKVIITLLILSWAYLNVFLLLYVPLEILDALEGTSDSFPKPLSDLPGTSYILPLSEVPTCLLCI